MLARKLAGPGRPGARRFRLGARLLGGLAMAAMAAWPSLPAQAYTPPVLRIGFAPFENQQDVLEKARPIVTALREALDMEVRPFVAGDYPGVVEAMKGGKLDVAIYSPTALVLAEKIAGAKVILKCVYKNRSVYYSTIITRTDSPLKKLSDLKGKTFAYVDPGSTTGGVFPKLMLLNAGVRDRDLKRVIFAGGHDAAVLAVLNKKVDAAATFANDPQGHDVPWKPMLKERAGEIRAIAYSKPIPNGAIAVSKNLDPVIVEKVKKALLRLGETPAGRAELAKMYLIDRFLPGRSEDYAPVREAFQKVGFSL